jgi:DNA-binding transcriptional LysR family regulator
LGFNLFDRNHYKAQLTTKGEAFYLKALELVTQFKQLEHSVHALRSGIEVRFSIDLDIALPITNYLSGLQTLIKKYSQTCFSLSNNTFVRCVERLKNKECDICLAASHIHDLNIEYLPISQVRMLPVTSKTYYEEYKKQIDNPNQNSFCMQIMIADTQDELEQINIEPLSPLMPQWLVGDMHTRKQLIVAGMGIGRLPDHLIQRELQTGELLQLNEKYYSAVTMNIFAMRLIHSEHGTVANHFWQMMQEISSEDTQLRF